MFVLTLSVAMFVDDVRHTGERLDGLVASFSVVAGVPAEHGQRYAARLGRARDLRGPVCWYRAALRPSRARLTPDAGPGRAGEELVRVPTTYVWGSRDPFLGRAAAERTGQHVAGDYRFVEVRAGHWLPEREPDLVAREIVARVRGVAPDPGRA